MNIHNTKVRQLLKQCRRDASILYAEVLEVDRHVPTSDEGRRAHEARRRDARQQLERVQRRIAIITRCARERRAAARPRIAVRREPVVRRSRPRSSHRVVRAVARPPSAGDGDPEPSRQGRASAARGAL